jgi:hypothetical protein
MANEISARELERTKERANGSHEWSVRTGLEGSFNKKRIRLLFKVK